MARTNEKVKAFDSPLFFISSRYSSIKKLFLLRKIFSRQIVWPLVSPLSHLFAALWFHEKKFEIIKSFWKQIEMGNCKLRSSNVFIAFKHKILQDIISVIIVICSLYFLHVLIIRRQRKFTKIQTFLPVFTFLIQ